MSNKVKSEEVLLDEIKYKKMSLVIYWYKSHISVF